MQKVGNVVTYEEFEVDIFLSIMKDRLGPNLDGYSEAHSSETLCRVADRSLMDW